MAHLRAAQSGVTRLGLGHLLERLPRTFVITTDLAGNILVVVSLILRGLPFRYLRGFTFDLCALVVTETSA